jgi:hypothetical protein
MRPLGVRMPRASIASAISRSVAAPARRAAEAGGEPFQVPFGYETLDCHSATHRVLATIVARKAELPGMPL